MNPTIDVSQLPLRDIHLPGPIGWWPPAPGWWLVAALVLVAVALYGVHYYRGRHKRAALRALTRVRTALEETRWRRANNLLARALQEGTERPSRIEELVHFGEEYTEHHYNPAYAPRDRGRGRTPSP